MIKEYLLYHMIALSAGLLTDAIIPDPQHFPHPIRGIGWLISTCERLLYPKDASKGAKGSMIARGGVLFFIVTIVTILLSGCLFIGAYFVNRYVGIAVEAFMTYFVMAAASLRHESMKVHGRLVADDLSGARRALSMIVGRDTDELSEVAIARAAVETVAENTSDGVIAPLLYTAVLGPVGGFFYKAINTMDSMIGYRNERYERFGKVAARADDVANFIPSRISALFMIVSAALAGIFCRIYSGCGALRTYIRDRYKHKSPNSAQTESACAGALGLRLGGPSAYEGRIVDKPFIGDDIRPIEAEDIRHALTLMYTAEILCTAVIFTIMKLILTSR